jgi:hypothetical protein
MKEAKAKYDPETFRKWKRARKKAAYQRLKAGPKTNIPFKAGPKTNILLKLKQTPSTQPPFALGKRKSFKRGIRVDRCLYMCMYIYIHTHTHTHYVYDICHRRGIHLRSARRMLNCAAGHLCCCWNAVCCWLCAAGCFVGPLLMLAKPAFK